MASAAPKPSPKINTAECLQKPCNETCIYQCSKIINKKIRLRILKYFQGLCDYDLQCFFIQKSVEQVEQSTSVFRRYSFTLNGKRIRVCKMFFLSTLAIKQSFLNDALNIMFVENALQQDKETMDLKLIEGVMNHIKSIPRIISSNIGKNGEQEYFETSVKVEKMYSLYIDYCKDHDYPVATFERYQEIFDSKTAVFQKCREIVPLLEANEVTLVTLKAENKQPQN